MAALAFGLTYADLDPTAAVAELAASAAPTLLRQACDHLEDLVGHARDPGRRARQLLESAIAVTTQHGHGHRAPIPVGIANRSSQPKVMLPEPPEHLLRRPRLEEAIRRGARQRLVLVTAPAGQGKTTAVAEALRDAPAVAWVTLGHAYGDLSRPEALVLGSLRDLVGAPLWDVAAWGAEAPRPMIGERFTASVDDFVVVIDDPDGLFHGTSARALERMLDVLPSNVHLVVLSRVRPAIRLERLRAHGGLTEVVSDELAFTSDEVAAYLNGAWRLGLDDETVGRIATITEGWPVALQCVASRLTHERDVRGFARRLREDDGGVLAPLVLEMLEDLEDMDRRFLLDIAVLDRLEPETCARLTGMADGSRHLERLAGAGLIVHARTEHRCYRHRPLVHRVLFEELRARSPEREPALHAIAASVVGRQGSVAEAVEHSLLAGDERKALELLETNLAVLLHLAGGRWFAATLQRVSAAAIVSRPTLLATQLDLAFLAGDRDALERVLDTIEDPTLSVASRPASLRRVRAYLSRLRGDGSAPLLASSEDGSLDPFIAHALGAAFAAEGRHDSAAAAYRQALDHARASHEPLRELAVIADLAWERATAGCPVEADRIARRAAELATSLGFPEPPLPAQFAVAQIALDRGRGQVARERASRVRAEVAGSGDLALRVDVIIFISRARWAHGDVAGAARALEDVDRELRDYTPGGGLIGRIARVRASLGLALGDVDAALAFLPPHPGEVQGLPVEDRLVAALLHLECGDAGPARQIIDSLRGEGIGPRLTMHALRIEASACRKLGDHGRAVRSTRQADRVARIEGLLPPDVHRPVPRPDRVHPTDGALMEIPASPLAPTTERLTQRELDVLRMLPNATNLEIAVELYVSVNTVKTHLKNIYRKLDVTSREAAAERAQEFALSC